MNEILQKLRAFNEERDWAQFHSPENLAKSVAIEAGELLECFQWNNDYKQSSVEEELADVMMYALMLTDAIGADPEEIISRKLEKNAQKYPVDRAKGSSKKYNELG